MSDVWKFAKELETEGRLYYEKLAAEARHEQLAGVFSLLAKEEERHFDLFDKMEKQQRVCGLPPSTVLGDARAAFKTMSSQFDEASVMESSDGAYMKALALENKSIEFYDDALRTVTDPQEQEALRSVLAEERKHAQIVEAIIDFTARPKQWLENAEFNHLEEY